MHKDALLCSYFQSESETEESREGESVICYILQTRNNNILLPAFPLRIAASGSYKFRKYFTSSALHFCLNKLISFFTAFLRIIYFPVKVQATVSTVVFRFSTRNIFYIFQKVFGLLSSRELFSRRQRQEQSITDTSSV